MTASGPSVGSYELGHYLRLLRRRWLPIVLCLALGLWLTLLGLARATPTYESTASVLVTPTIGDSSAELSGGRTNGSDVNLDTESRLVTSIVVAEGARKLLRTSTPAPQLTESVAVSVPANTQVLNVTFSAPTAVGAQQGAHAFAQAYLEARARTAKDAVENQVTGLRAQLKDLTKQLDDVSSQVGALPTNSADRASAEAQQRVLVDQITALRLRLSPLDSTPVTPGSIITDAQQPKAPTKPDRRLWIATGVFAGLLLGIVLALLRESLDRRVRSAAEVPATLGIPLLAELRRGEVTGLTDPDTGPGNAGHDLLRNALLSHLPPESPQAVVVAGVTTGPAAGAVAYGSAVALAAAGYTTILVCADPAQPPTALLPDDDAAGVGLVELLDGTATFEDVLRQSKVEGLLVIAAGGRSTARTGLHGGVVRSVLAQLRDWSDYVIVAAPTATSSADAQTLALQADGAVIVAELRRTLRDRLRYAAYVLGSGRSRLLGAVVVPAGTGQGRGRLSRQRSSNEEPAVPGVAGTSPAGEPPVDGGVGRWRRSFRRAPGVEGNAPAPDTATLAHDSTPG